MDPDREVPVTLVPLHPLRQCQMWNCQKDKMPYCSLSHQLLSATEEDKVRAIVIVDGLAMTEQERLSQKILKAKSEDESTGVPSLPDHVLHQNPRHLEQFEFNLLGPESSRDWLFITDNVKPAAGIWKPYDTKNLLGMQRARYNMNPQPDFGAYKLHKYTYTAGNYNRALYWLTFSGPGGLANQN